VHPAVESLARAFRTMADRFRTVVKAGRTHLMDATPVTVGQEAAAWAGLLERAVVRSRAHLEALGELPLGGTAVGTGINAPPGFAAAVIERLAEETGLPLRPSDDPMVQQGGQGALADASAGLRGIAIALTKIANDIRLLASGPSCGIGELLLPELQAIPRLPEVVPDDLAGTHLEAHAVHNGAAAVLLNQLIGDQQGHEAGKRQRVEAWHRGRHQSAG